jgi:hypothetical protein
MIIIPQMPEKLHFIASCRVGEIWEGYKKKGEQGWQLYVFTDMGWETPMGMSNSCQKELFNLRDSALKENPGIEVELQVAECYEKNKKMWLGGRKNGLK